MKYGLKEGKNFGASDIESNSQNYVNGKEINEYMKKINSEKYSRYIETSLNSAYHSYFSNGTYSVMPLSIHQEYAGSALFLAIFNKYCIDSLLKNGKTIIVSDFKSSDGFNYQSFEELKKIIIFWNQFILISVGIVNYIF